MGNLMQTFLSGEVSGSAAAKQLPDIACSKVKIKAVQTNADFVYVGFSSGVTKIDGTTDVTTGWELDASEETPWIPVENLNEIWIICTAASDDIVYMAFRP